MTDREQRLLAIAQRLRRSCVELRAEVAELSTANAELRVERDAADVLLGEAMDEVRTWRESER